MYLVCVIFHGICLSAHTIYTPFNQVVITLHAACECVHHVYQCSINRNATQCNTSVGDGKDSLTQLVQHTVQH